MLFDDIESEMCPADKKAFGSFAHAQVAVTNTVYQHLEEPDIFLFCPTGGTASSCRPGNRSNAVWRRASRGRFKRASVSLLKACAASLCVALCSLQITVLRSALQLCPSRLTCRPSASSSCLG